jgi:thioredoxin-related protein
MKPRWKKIEKEYPVFESEYFEYDDSPEKVKEYGIEEGSLPTFIFLDKNGNELERIEGEISEEKIIELINKYKDK